MVPFDRIDRVRRLAVTVLIVPFVVGVAGCATGSDTTRRPSTPYKGDAVWNISSNR